MQSAYQNVAGYEISGYPRLRVATGTEETAYHREVELTKRRKYANNDIFIYCKLSF